MSEVTPLRFKGFECSAVGLSAADNLTQRQWEAAGEALGSVEARLNWYVGDWLRACKGEAWGYGQLEETCKRFDLNYQTAANAKSVCDTFEFSRRRENLTFSHHAEVQGRPDADELLDWCEETTPPRKVKDLRDRKKQLKKQRIADLALQMIDGDSAKHVRNGDWWKLGDHLLYCGDTSQPEFIDRLEKAAFCFADPPYGAGKEGYDDSVFYWEHDYLIQVGEVVAVTPGIVSIFEFAKKTEMPYLWSVACWINNGMTRGAMGFGNWIYAAIFSHGSIYRSSQDFFQVSISLSDHKDTSHTTRKPSTYMVWMVEVFSKPGELVIDPFAGSGQTLMACQATGRRCITGELDPKFCSAIIARWEAMTGGYASKL
jgi:DNA modification methylase